MQCECNEPKKRYTNLKIINLIVPVPAFAGMTKHAFDRHDKGKNAI